MPMGRHLIRSFEFASGLISLKEFQGGVLILHVP